VIEMKKPVQFYSSIPCYEILEKYSKESKFSISRTIEEIIWAFNDIDKLISKTTEDIPSSLLINLIKINTDRLKLP